MVFKDLTILEKDGEKKIKHEIDLDLVDVIDLINNWCVPEVRYRDAFLFS
ncbi:hypothetical protein J2W55_004778 [Mucilaginibacter pocheonensis]|uniref:Uncharacterized protein n=1 Tax=Mucilaginibacter pocheonensis TaxID=398050 RepID=A0ABU1TJ75_9SPHI|nr:hypothetical protein [Mucilaginibacter pocheonensis]